MLFKKANIVSFDWLELVFDGRNKSYGAYVIRQKANHDLARALYIGLGIFSFLIVGPYAWHSGFGLRYIQTPTVPETDRPIEVVFEPKTTVDEKPQPLSGPKVPSSAKPRTDQVRMRQPVVVPAVNAKDEVPSVELLQKATPGPKTLAGEPGAAIHIDVAVNDRTTGSGTAAGYGTGDAIDGVFEQVEAMPSFPGGMSAFLDYVAKHYRIPADGQHGTVKGRLVIKFVVEKDGTLTGFEVMHDLGKGTGEEAIRVLRKAPRWKPGLQNGRPVRVYFTLPIRLG